MLSNFFQHRNIALDIGTETVRLLVPPGKDSIKQATMVAKNKRTQRIIAIGDDARRMYGRTPPHAEIIEPVAFSEIDDPEAAEALLSMLLYKERTTLERLFGDSVTVAVPAGTNDVTLRNIARTLRQTGAREITAIPTPLAALVGIGLAVGDPLAHTVIDLGAGTTTVGVVSRGNLTASSSTELAGREFDQRVCEFLEEEFGLRISRLHGQELKHSLAFVPAGDAEPAQSELSLYGQDAASGLPREITVSAADTKGVVTELVDEITTHITDFIKSLPADTVADIATNGIHLVGALSKLPGLDEHFRAELSVPVHVHEDPGQAVINGVAETSQNPQAFSAAAPISSYYAGTTE